MEEHITFIETCFAHLSADGFLGCYSLQVVTNDTCDEDIYVYVLIATMYIFLGRITG